MAFDIASILVAWVDEWVSLESRTWPYVGLFCGTMLVLAWIARKSIIGSLLVCAAVLAAGFELALYFWLPDWSVELFSKLIRIPRFHLVLFVAGAVTGAICVIIIIRLTTPVLEFIKNALTKTSNLERNKKTDIRSIRVHIPNHQEAYDPTEYFSRLRGIFFGLDEHRRPVYLPRTKWEESNMQVVGPTGSGKGVVVGVILTQAVRHGHSVFVLDPKGDQFLPHVLYQAAKDAEVPYGYLDLTANVPQWNPLMAKSAYEIEELFAAGFDLSERGTEADYYRLDDRHAALVISEMISRKPSTLLQALQGFITEQPELAKLAKNFVHHLREVASTEVTHTAFGLNIGRVMQKGGVVYVRGATRNPRVQMLQRMFVISVIQHAEARVRESATRVTVFLDEFKYLISRPALEALGTIRDKKVHVIVAHQSLGDLRGGPGDIDSDAVVGAVNDNCTLKITYQVQDPDTADWFARLSGEILVDEELRGVRTNPGLAETRDGERTLRQTVRCLVDTNMLQALPARCAVLYGAGLARFIFTSPIKVEKSEEAVAPAAALPISQGDILNDPGSSPIDVD
jgi:hypothetical protein